MTEPLDFISGRGAAKLLGLSPATLGRRVEQGALIPYGRLENGGFVFRREDLIPPGAPEDPADYKGCSECDAYALDNSDFCAAHQPVAATDAA